MTNTNLQCVPKILICTVFKFLSPQVIQVASVSDQNDNIKDEIARLDGTPSFLFMLLLLVLFPIYMLKQFWYLCFLMCLLDDVSIFSESPASDHHSDQTNGSPQSTILPPLNTNSEAGDGVFSPRSTLQR